MSWDEWVSANGVLVPNPVPPVQHAWRYVDTGLSDLHQAPPVRNTENIVIPHAPGRYPVEKNVDEMVAQIPLQIRGWYDRLGGRNDDPAQGLTDNFAYLKANLGIADVDAPGTQQTIVWHQSGGAEYTGSAFVELVGFEKKTYAIAKSVLRLTFCTPTLTLVT